MLTFLITGLLIHPVHETVSEIEWNAKTGRLEVALRLDGLDEQWLRKRVARDDEVSAWAIRYLQSRFRVAAAPENGQLDSTTYHWIGRDEEGSHVWWYFEIATKNRLRPTWIDQRVLFERDENYSNRILILGQVPRRSLTLTIQRPKANLDPPADESESTKPDAAPPIDR